MSRLIDADAFEVVTTKIPDGVDAESYMAGMDFVLNKIDDAPTIEPEREKGKWIWKLDEGDPSRSMMLVCSKCGSGRNEVGEYNFCHICGAKMINAKGEQNEID